MRNDLDPSYAARSRRVILALATLTALASCSPQHNKRSSQLPINPTPTKPGQVMILAGNGTGNSGPTDGAYAVRTAAPAIGGIAALSDGSLYFPVTLKGRGRLAHLTPDGRIHIGGSAANGDQLILHGSTLWQISSTRSNGATILSLYRISLRDERKSIYFELNDQNRGSLSIIGARGVKLAKERRAALDQYWKGSVAGLRSDGKPILANSHGDLFLVLDNKRLEYWKPEGYQSALNQVTRPDINDADRDLRPSFIISDNVGVTTILGDPGIIRIPENAKAEGSQFTWKNSNTRAYFHTTGAASLDGRSLLAVDGSIDANMRLAIIASDGKIDSPIETPERSCDNFHGVLDDVAAGQPTGIAKRPDGSFAVTNAECNRVYVFRMAE